MIPRGERRDGVSDAGSEPPNSSVLRYVQAIDGQAGCSQGLSNIADAKGTRRPLASAVTRAPYHTL